MKDREILYSTAIDSVGQVSLHKLQERAHTQQKKLWRLQEWLPI
jgi:hypothetical protein